MPRLDELFSPEAEAAVRTAVDRAERRTSGEIVPYVVAESDAYVEATYQSALLGALLGSLLAAAFGLYTDWWPPSPLVAIALPVFSGAALGWAAVTLVPVLRRWLVGARTLKRRTRRRAAVAFLEEEVFKTRDRTGILVFLSLFEHQVVVLGDEGINRAVDPGEWEAIVAGLVAGIRRGEPAAALVEAVTACGELLETHGVDIRPDDTDELSDDLRVRDD